MHRFSAELKAIHIGYATLACGANPPS